MGNKLSFLKQSENCNYKKYGWRPDKLDIRDHINNNLKLSMGMSNDYEIALSLKSDLVRIGSRIFK